MRESGAFQTLRTEDEEFVPARHRVPAARQLCHGSLRQLEKNPQFGKCPLCERKLIIEEVNTRRRDPKTHDIIFTYTVPSHLPKRI